MSRATILLGVGLVLGGLALAQEPAVREVRITAEKYKYTPAEIRVQAGEKVRLVLTALDRKHGFAIKVLGIKVEVEKGKETVVEITAPASGEIEFKCSVFCGLGHRKMKGKLVVEPAPG